MPANRLLPTSIILILAGTFLCVPALLAQVPTPEAPGVRSEVYAVAPTRSGDKELRVDLYRPQGRSVRGAVLLVHGGAFVTGARDIAENQAYGEALAARGYLAAAMSYRLLGDEPVVDGWAAAYAQTVRQSQDLRVQAGMAQYGADFSDAVAASAEDVVAAIRWLRGHASEFGFDADNVAVFGASAGAISALTVAYAMDDYGAEPVDLAAVISLRGLLLPPGASSPLERRDPSLLILHGEADERVPVSYADSLFISAQEAGVYVEFYSAPGFGHELGGSALLSLHTHVDETVLDRMDAFLSSVFDDERRIVPSVRGRLIAAGPSSADHDGATVRSEMRAAVGALIEAVDEEAGFVESLYGLLRRDKLVHDFDDPQREDWSYWPRTRAGLPLRHMTAPQRMLTQDILATLLSAKGYLQANHVMMLEEVLADLETTGFSRGAEEYTVTVFGMPGEEKPWAFRFEGHHLSLNVTVAPDAITVTPSFIGAAPAVIPSGARAGFGPLKYEEHVAFALLHSLSEEQRAAAVLAAEPPAEILSTPFQVERADWDRWHTLLAREGVSASTFDAEQRHLLRRLLVEIVGTYRDEISRAYLSAVDLRTLTFAWMGGSERGQPHYFRIQGDHFVFELDAAQEEGNHVHTVWRDRDSDFGADALERHYEQHKH